MPRPKSWAALTSTYRKHRGRSNGYHICGSAIISDLWVLTVAHCVRNNPPAKFSFRVGSTSRKSGGKVYHVEQVLKHEGYEAPVVFNDICLLKSTSQIEFGDSVQAAVLPPLGAKHPQPGITVRASGWGATEAGGTNTLKAVDIELYDFAYCRKILHISSRGTRVCAEAPNKNTCHGDSGGPLTAGNLLVGITSYGLDKCGRKPQIYSDVAAYRPWIHKHTGL